MPTLKVLGVWVDSKLRWTQHITQATQKGLERFSALTRITGPTWGLTFNKTRLLFNATIRSAFTHRGPIWALGDIGQGLPENTLKPLQTLQNKCVRLIAGAYTRTPTAALQKETDTPPLSIYLQALALNYAENTRNSDVEKQIQTRCAQIKHRLLTGIVRRPEIQKTPQESLRETLFREKQQQPHGNSAAQRHENHQEGSEEPTQGHLTRRNPVPHQTDAHLRSRPRSPPQLSQVTSQSRPPFTNAQSLPHETRNAAPQRQTQTQRSGGVAKSFLKRKWDQYFHQKAHGKLAEIWHQDLKENGAALREGLSPAEAAIATQLRSRTVGLRAYLAKWGVPGIQPTCECDPWEERYRETVEHVILHCPLRSSGRAEMLAAAGSRDLSQILTKKRGIQAVTRWVFEQGILPQFAYARKLATNTDKPPEWLPFPFLEDVREEEGGEIG